MVKNRLITLLLFFNLFLMILMIQIFVSTCLMIIVYQTYVSEKLEYAKESRVKMLLEFFHTINNR
jgi:hypothetical protein